MRLGLYEAKLQEGSQVAKVYGALTASERHRHRYEVNNDYRDALLSAGLILSGTSPDKRLVEMVELSGHPWFVGCQFHPELKSRPMQPHPLFVRFVRAAMEYSAGRAASRPREERASVVH
jgi:CTP synthase